MSERTPAYAAGRREPLAARYLALLRGDDRYLILAAGDLRSVEVLGDRTAVRLLFEDGSHVDVAAHGRPSGVSAPALDFDDGGA